MHGKIYALDITALGMKDTDVTSNMFVNMKFTKYFISIQYGLHWIHDYPLHSNA
jgi:hypothetical protein